MTERIVPLLSLFTLALSPGCGPQGEPGLTELELGAREVARALREHAGSALDARALGAPASSGLLQLSLENVVAHPRVNPAGKVLARDRASQLVDLLARLEHDRRSALQQSEEICQRAVQARIQREEFLPAADAPELDYSGAVYRETLHLPEHGSVVVDIDLDDDPEVACYFELSREVERAMYTELRRFFDES